MSKPGIKIITVKRLVSFLLLASLIMLTIISLSFRSISQKIVEDKALALSQIVMAGLTAHMKSNIMHERHAFLDEIRSLKEVNQISILRSPALKTQYGPSLEDKQQSDPLADAVFQSNLPVFVMSDFDFNPNIRALIPYIARSGKLESGPVDSKSAVNCLNCHDVAEGTVLGIIDIELNLTAYRNLSFKAVAAIGFSAALFLILLVFNSFKTIQDLVKAPLDILITEAKKAFFQHKPVDTQKFESLEFHRVAEEINLFNAEILETHLLLEKKNEALTAMNAEIEATLKETVFTIGLIEEQRSQETINHTRRVGEYCKHLATTLGLPQQDIDLLTAASPLHDVGKLGISDTILLKPGRLTAAEQETMKQHAEMGHQMLMHSKHPILKAAAMIAKQHHERWDGSGYPQGLQGEEIHRYGRVVALADVFDALISKRVYKEAWALEEIIPYIKKERGQKFDPHMADVFLENIDAYVAIHNRHQELP